MYNDLGRLPKDSKEKFDPRPVLGGMIEVRGRGSGHIWEV